VEDLQDMPLNNSKNTSNIKKKAKTATLHFQGQKKKKS
jgi:hypothetical protein